MLSSEDQARLRLRLFAELEILVDQKHFFTFAELQNFKFEGVHFPLVTYGGLFNPAIFDETLSIISKQGGPYQDHIGDDGLLRYAFRAGDPQKGFNRKLRAAIANSTPLILFESPESNLYVPIFPVYAIAEDLEAGFITVAAGDDLRLSSESGGSSLDRSYVERVVRQRLHQPVFRARVLKAYSSTCAVCRLKHAELLDAAHIVPDAQARGLPVVSNGMALCKLHHAAFDQNLLGVDTSYRVHINGALLLEEDGPMLKHGLQAMNGTVLNVPELARLKPDKDALAERFEKFTSHA